MRKTRQSLVDRRDFISHAAVGVIALPVVLSRQERPAPLDLELVNEFVRVAHGDLERTRELLLETPALLNATWDWGGGDFETALGGASHMGHRSIAEFLLSHGARIDLFCAAMLGLGNVVEPIVAVYPNAVHWKGPHGISLLRHAQAGAQDDLADYLISQGAT